jgi:hypothetical protein
MSMKLKLETRRLTPRHSLALVTAIVIVLALGALILLRATGVLTGPGGRADDGSSGKVEGKLTIDGKAAELKYVYAQRDWPGCMLVDVIVTNRPLQKASLGEILDGKYRGSDNLRGLWMLFDSSGAYKGERLLIQSGAVPAASGVVMSMMDGNQNTRIENDRITAKLAAKIDSPARSSTFSVSFDAAIKVTLPDIDTTAVVTSPEQFQSDFARVIPGQWSIERWRSSGGSFYTGTLVVDQPLTGGKLKGTLHIADLTNDQKLDEDVTISPDGTKVLIEGHVAPDAKWAPDTFSLELKGGVLIGDNRDQQGSEGNVVLRKMP